MQTETTNAGIEVVPVFHPPLAEALSRHSGHLLSVLGEEVDVHDCPGCGGCSSYMAMIVSCGTCDAQVLAEVVGE